MKLTICFVIDNSKMIFGDPFACSILSHKKTTNKLTSHAKSIQIQMYVKLLFLKAFLIDFSYAQLTYIYYN